MDQDATTKQLQAMEEVISRFQRVMRKYFLPQKHGLTGSQIFILRYLASCPRAKASSIAKVSGLSPGAVTQVCDELVRMGLVERARSDDDRRVVHVAITEAGRKTFESIRKVRSGRARAILEELGSDDVNEFLRIVNRMVEIVESEAEGKRS